MHNYILSIMFKSNERPFSMKDGDYGAHEDDEQARNWAASMQDLLPDYYVTLFDVNGRHISYDPETDLVY